VDTLAAGGGLAFLKSRGGAGAGHQGRSRKKSGEDHGDDDFCNCSEWILVLADDPRSQYSKKLPGIIWLYSWRSALFSKILSTA
jgi:hypothetical protein